MGGEPTSEPRLCACNCGEPISDRNASGYRPGHRQRVLARTGVLAEQRRAEAARVAREATEEAARPKPVVSEKPVAISGERVLYLLCREHNQWGEWPADNGRKPPAPDTRHDLCPQCIARREQAHTPSDERIVVDPALAYRSLADDLTMAAWRERQAARNGVRSGSVEEGEILAQMDEARNQEQVEIDRLRDGRRSRRRGYLLPAFRESY